MTLGPLMIDLVGPSVLPEERDMLAHPLVGGVILFTRNYESPEQLLQLTRDIHAVRSPPLLIAVDHEGGRVQRFRNGFSRLPPARRIGQLFDTDRSAGLGAARSMGWLMAAELRAHGVDLSFAPTVDLDYGLNETIGDRALHPTAEVTAQLAVAYMMGMREAGMAATAKHFPGHGAVVADSHVSMPVDRRQLADLDQDLAPYRLLISQWAARRHGRAHPAAGRGCGTGQSVGALDPRGVAHRPGFPGCDLHRRPEHGRGRGRERHRRALPARAGRRLRHVAGMQ